MDRRSFLAAAGTLSGVAALAAPALGRAAVRPALDAYYDRLTARCADCGGGRFDAVIEDLLFPLHNGFRAEQGVAALQRHADLDLAARAHAADLLHRRYFAHASPEGFTSEHRVGLIARRFVGASGENIVEQEGGSEPPDAVELTRLWKDSPGHRANMLRERFTHVGFGAVRGGDATISAAVFGEMFTELAAPAPFRIGDGQRLANVFIGTPGVTGYELHDLDDGEVKGPFAADAAPPERLAAGAWAIHPHAPDPAVANRYFILYGPIVMAG